MLAWLDALTPHVSPEALLTCEADCAPYLREWRDRWAGKTAAVLRPGTTEEAAMMVRITGAHGIALVPQGGHTGLCGGAMPDASGQQVIICSERLSALRHMDAANNTMTVEAGMTLLEAQNTAAAQNRLFPLSLASEGSCHIGGTIATNAGGVHVVRYGPMRNLVLGLEVILPNGDIWSNLKGLRKDNTGYDLKQLFIGAEGTLGFITAATLKLFPRPTDHTAVLCAVDSPHAALETFHRLHDSLGARLVAAELLPRIGLEFVLKHIPQTRDPLPRPSPWYVLFDIEHHAYTQPPKDKTDQTLTHTLAQSLDTVTGFTDAVISTSTAQRLALWRLRDSMSEAQKPEGGSIKHDIAVPISRIPEFMERAEHLVQGWLPGTRIVAFGHMGDGNLHYNLSQPVNMDKQAFLARWSEAAALIHDLVLSLDGTISAEHGIGVLKRDELAQILPDSHKTLMARLKSALDPQNRMNPGKVLIP